MSEIAFPARLEELADSSVVGYESFHSVVTNNVFLHLSSFIVLELPALSSS